MQENRYFIDTNIILRYLLNDIPEQAKILESLIKKSLDGQIQLITNSMVIAEVVWTLKSFYKFSKKEIDDLVSPIVVSDAITINEKDILLQALENCNQLNIDFTDAYIGAWMVDNHIKQVFTFNEKDFKRIKNVHISHLSDIL